MAEITASQILRNQQIALARAKKEREMIAARRNKDISKSFKQLLKDLKKSGIL